MPESIPIEPAIPEHNGAEDQIKLIDVELVRDPEEEEKPE